LFVKKPSKAAESSSAERIQISPPNLKRTAFQIIGDAPLVVHAFSQKARGKMHDTHVAGPQARKGKKREPRDFEAEYEASKHVSPDGWCGFPASAFRNAMISACRMVGFKMTHAKLSVFVEPDGFEADGTPLVKITKGAPQYHEGYVRNETGVVDLRARAMWKPGWEMVVRVKYDADQFSTVDIANLMLRAGMQVGIGEGRPDSKKSAGMGWGTFTLKGKEN
jgi:hypothetical protein